MAETPDTAASPYEAALLSIRWFEADDNMSLTPDYLRKILLELGFTHSVEVDRHVAVCGEHHIFPRDTFARTARAEVWCTSPAGHDGPHESTKGSMAFTWRDDVQDS